jgi:acetylornithine deacetylase/succinyl-diaminopimelate desuccinylase-like protein
MREAALAEAVAMLDDGRFAADLARRVAIPSESQDPAQAHELHRYLETEMQPSLEALGFICESFANPKPGAGPIFLAERIEDPAFPTMLSYGHGDVALGIPAQWRTGLNPWAITTEGDRVYGRGTADNKGQHSVNIAALAAVLAVRGTLGFNVKLLIEMAEETGSPGLRDFCIAQKDRLAADVFIGSDGPRLSPDRPTIFLGARGAMNFDLAVELREGAFHSGNWGGLLANPAVILAQALATITSPTGAIRVREWVPESMPNSVRMALADCPVEPGPDAPTIDPGWGEPGLTAPEKVFGWSSFEILSLDAGNPANPINAIPPRAKASCQIRYVVGPAWLPHGERDALEPRRVRGEPAGPGGPVGALGDGVGAGERWDAPVDPAEYGWVRADRRVLRRIGTVDAMGAAFLRRLRPAWGERAYAAVLRAAVAGGDGGVVLGFGGERAGR